VIPKSAEQRARINAAVHANFLFKSLDEEQFEEVVDAMAEKKIVAGEEVLLRPMKCLLAITYFFACMRMHAIHAFLLRSYRFF
jgi:hypothetical protein